MIIFCYIAILNLFSISQLEILMFKPFIMGVVPFQFFYSLFRDLSLNISFIFLFTLSWLRTAIALFIPVFWSISSFKQFFTIILYSSLWHLIRYCIFDICYLLFFSHLTELFYHCIFYCMPSSENFSSSFSFCSANVFVNIARVVMEL